MTDISPVRALIGLRQLQCSGSSAGAGKLADLAPLQGIKLKTLNFESTQVADLSPLKGMPLTKLLCANTQVSDLSPLVEISTLENLSALGTGVTRESVAALEAALPNCVIEWDDPAKPKTPEPAASGTK